MLDEQIALAGVTGGRAGHLPAQRHLPAVLPVFCNDEQKQRWLPGIASGELITAVGMTEPGAGSDLAGIRTSAKRDGEHYVVNGSKTFITNGINADLVITAVRTGEDRHKGMSLLILERGMPGFERGRNLDKLGLHSQDTAELSFTDVRVPVENLLGEEGAGLRAADPEAAAGAHVDRGQRQSPRRAPHFEETLRYVQDRKAFGTTIGSFQNTKFVLAEIVTEIDIAQAFVDQCVDRLNDGELQRRRRGEGQVVVHRAAGPRHRPVPAAARRIRLHERVPDLAALRRRPGDPHLRRHDRDHEERRQQVAGAVSTCRFVLASASPARLARCAAPASSPRSSSARSTRTR